MHYYRSFTYKIFPCSDPQYTYKYTLTALTYTTYTHYSYIYYIYTIYTIYIYYILTLLTPIDLYSFKYTHSIHSNIYTIYINIYMVYNAPTRHNSDLHCLYTDLITGPITTETGVSTSIACPEGS